MAKSCIRVGAVPDKNGDTIDNEIAGEDSPTAEGGEDVEDKERLRQRRATKLAALALLRRDFRMRGWPSLSRGKLHARAKAGHERSQSRISA